MRNTGDIVEGRDLMVFLNTGSSSENPTFTPQAAATNHTVSYSGETKERVTKDTANGAWAQKKVTKLGCSIKSDALVSIGDQAGWKALLAAYKERKPVLLKYGFTEEEAGEEYETGMFVITSLEQNSPAGDDATYSVTFENTGEIKTESAA